MSKIKIDKEKIKSVLGELNLSQKRSKIFNDLSSLNYDSCNKKEFIKILDLEKEYKKFLKIKYKQFEHYENELFIVSKIRSLI